MLRAERPKSVEDIVRLQHPVAEDVAVHAADAHHREGLLIDILAQFAKVPPHANPSAARSNAEPLADDNHVSRRVAKASAEPESHVEPLFQLARSDQAAVPLSAATTRYGS